MNASDHNPTIRVGLSPKDSWELATPQMMQYFVKGGAYSNGKSGYIVSNANWDPYPLANKVEAFTIALGNMDVAVFQRFYKFAYPFHTGIRAADVMTPAQMAGAAPQGNGTTIVAYWGQVEQTLAPDTPIGIASDAQNNGDIESQPAAEDRQVPRRRARHRAPADPGLDDGGLLDGRAQGAGPQSRVWRRAGPGLGGLSQGLALGRGRGGQARAPAPATWPMAF